MKGIYFERDIYDRSEVTSWELIGLFFLGIKTEPIENGAKIKILGDTSEQDHCLCDDEDAIALIRHKRRDTL